MKIARIGLLGYKFMGKAHSQAYKDVKLFFNPEITPVMRVICGRDKEGVKKAMEQFGWESYDTNWRDLVARKDIDVIDISTPGDVHKEQAIAFAKAGKDILCEKPLANTLKEAKEMLAAVQKAKVKHMIMFNYRFIPAVSFAKQMIAAGELGTIYHYRGYYLQDWIVDPNFPLVWRLQKERAGSGALGDIAAHSIDMARFLIGEFDKVVGNLETFIHKRPLLAAESGLSAKGKKGDISCRLLGKVTVDDAATFIAKFKNGAVGSFEATRFATGRKNFHGFEINGSKGSLAFNFESMNELYYYDRTEAQDQQGFKRILVTESLHPHMAGWWPPGHILGYQNIFVNAIAYFLDCLAKNKMPSPNFEDGVKCQMVMDAIERSSKQQRWIKI